MKKIIPMVIAIVVVGGISFYGGMKYDQSKKSNTGGSDNFANLTPAERQQRFAQAGGMRRGGTGGLGDAGFVNGELISIDGGSMILKSTDGGSKVVIYSTSTQVMKFSSGAMSDLKVGDNLMINGSTNQGGSITAQTIQIRSLEQQSTTK